MLKRTKCYTNVLPTLLIFNMISINIICRTERANKAGLAPIVVRITKSRRHAIFSTGVKIKPVEWNDKKSRVKPSHSNYKQINLLLSKTYAKIEALALDLSRQNKSYSVKQFKDWYLNKSSDNVISYFENWITSRKDRGTITYSTKIKYDGILDKLKAYTKGYLNNADFTEGFCEKFHKHLATKYENHPNTIASNMRCLRALANSMVRDRLIKVDDNPFLRYKIKTIATERKALQQSDIAKLRLISLPVGSKLEESRLIFLFCYETGMRIGDALHLRINAYDGSHITYYSQKTKAQVSQLLTLRAKEIIGGQIEKNQSRTPFVFNFLDESILNDEAAALNKQKSSTALINKNLKTIGTRAGIQGKFSTHFGRHSIATHALTQGLTYAEVKGILNHKDVKTTQNYAKVIDIMKDAAIKKLENL